MLRNSPITENAGNDDLQQRGGQLESPNGAGACNSDAASNHESHRSTPISRRRFCGQLAGAVAVTALGSKLGYSAEAEPFSLDYIVGSCMYGTTSLAEILPEIHKAGATHIDIWPRRHGDQREQVEKMGVDAFGRLLQEHNVKLGMLTHYDLGPFKLEQDMPLAKRFGARLMISGSGGPKGLEGDELKQAMKGFVEKMKPHVAAAEEAGYTIGIENHANALLDSPDSLRWLAEYSNSPNLGIAMAPYHLPDDAALLSKLIEDVGDRLVHFYAWQHGMGCHKKLPKEQELLQMPGRGALDFVPIVRSLKKINYDRWTEIFMHPVPRGIPILEPTSAVTAEINRARAYLAECVKQV
jgi:sugar phosphate isomerase/epimerase